MIPHFVYTLATFNGFTGVLWGAGLACLGKQIRAEIITSWHALCAFGHRMHIAQTTIDDTAVALIDKAKPAINQALDDAKAGLIAERTAAAAVEADTVQNGFLAPKPVDAQPLPPVVAAVVVAQ